MSYPLGEDTGMENPQLEKPIQVPIVNRLKRAHGHLQHIIQMIEGNKSPGVIAQQLQGVEQAIRKAKKIFILDRLDEGIEDRLGALPLTERNALRELQEPPPPPPPPPPPH